MAKALGTFKRTSIVLKGATDGLDTTKVTSLQQQAREIVSL